MRSNDFSAAPPQARAGSFFLGCNRYRSPLAMLGQIRRWPKLARALKHAPGYLWHRSYYEFPDRIGLLVAFATRDDLLRFARTPEHHTIMHWLVGGDGSSPARGGFIRILDAEEWGYTNGEFRAEDGRLGLIDRFSPVTGESADAPTTGGPGTSAAGQGTAVTAPAGTPPAGTSAADRPVRS
ncbi:hypothetical protein AB0I45_00225 [Brevibacterium sp. NPDC049920]|uniref:hypothetical protein n=1 Tax=Brevibacterium sp. NPDC049920 TaxID=3155279 RepID=UPI0033E54662